MKVVHQFVPVLEPGAVGAHTLQVQRLLRELGAESEVFAAELHPEFAGAGRLYADYGGAVRAGKDDVLLYQVATGSAVADFLLERRERLAVNYHNLTPVRFFEGWEPAAVHSVTWGWAQVRKLAARTELGIAVSAYNERELWGAGYATTAVAPVLVDVEAFDREVDEGLLERLGDAKAEGGADLLFVGRLAPNKAQHDLVKAFALYRRLYDPRARLHLVGGSSSESYRAALVSFAAGLGLADAVRFPGSVSAGELAAHYRAADVFVCVSEHEGFCVPLLEAMHHRLPIVAYGAAAVPETLQDAGVLLAHKDPATVAAATHRVLTDKDLAAALEARAAARLGQFSLERTRRRFAEVIGPLLGAN
jgi:glycosyltransferase involved in cell wall biosynthesis